LASIRPATRVDFITLLAEPLPWRVRALTVEHEGVPIGIGGLAFMPDGTVAAFVHAETALRRFRVTLHRAGLRMMREAEQLGVRRIVAMADPDVEAAVAWLKRLGFKETIVHGEKVYEWRIPSQSDLA
jgi:RimJ/RimL family protein N-acetyltransferase